MYLNLYTSWENLKVITKGNPCFAWTEDRREEGDVLLTVDLHKYNVKKSDEKDKFIVMTRKRSMI